MKNYFLNSIIMLLAIFQSCTDDAGPESLSPSGSSLEILSKISVKADSRMDGNAFETGDEVGIFLVPYRDDDTTPGDMDQSGYASNVSYQYHSGIWKPVSTPAIRWPGESRADVYGYYPYDARLTDARSLLFSVKEDQRSVDNYAASDFLWAKAGGLTPARQVQLVYSHRMAKVNVNIESAMEDFDNGSDDMRVYLSGVYTEAEIDLTHGTSVVPAGATPAEVYMNRPVSSSEDQGLFSYTAIVVPQTVSEGERVLVIENQGVTYSYQLTKEIELKRGTTFTFNILINDGRLVVTFTSVNDWIDAGSYDGELTRHPKILDLNGLDWELSNVHYVYDKEAIVGMVAKEYLFSRTISSLDFPAIVVYPADEEGNADLSRGFVARVLQRTMNSSSLDFDPNTASVHGGQVVFNTTANEIARYTKGSLSFISKVELSTSGEIKAANDLYLPTLDTQPYRLEDPDGYNYPVVKIAKQYWTRENLKTEHYRDGSAINVYYFNNDREKYRDLYGGLYTWTDMMDERGMIPEGWHVPNETEWWSLRDYLYPNPAYKLKERRIWITLGSTDNVAFFSGLPAGRRLPGGTFNEHLYYGQWWSSTERSKTVAWRVWFDTGAAISNGNLEKTYAESVRLMKDL